MKKFEKIKEWISLFLEKPYIPKELKNAKGPLLLHISDTPQEIYNYIIELAKKLKPTYIIHTGDLVDNVKLGIRPQEIEKYKNSLKGFIFQLEKCCCKDKIYYAIGNHDNIEIVKEISKKGIVVIEGHIMIEGIQFYISHYYLENPIKSCYYLFGHSFNPKSHRIQGQTFLNGLQKINVIDLTTKKVYCLSYPFGTNQFRRMVKRSVGL